jgi:hypothetical protein
MCTLRGDAYLQRRKGAIKKQRTMIASRSKYVCVVSVEATPTAIGSLIPLGPQRPR